MASAPYSPEGRMASEPLAPLQHAPDDSGWGLPLGRSFQPTRFRRWPWARRTHLLTVPRATRKLRATQRSEAPRRTVATKRRRVRDRAGVSLRQHEGILRRCQPAAQTPLGGCAPARFARLRCAAQWGLPPSQPGLRCSQVCVTCPAMTKEFPNDQMTNNLRRKII